MIFAVPALTPVTKPSIDTVATEKSPLIHITFWFVALYGIITAESFSVPSTGRLIDSLLRSMPVTGTSMELTITVTVQEA